MASVNKKLIEEIQGLIDAHERFGEELKSEFDECKEITRYGFVELIDQNGGIKDKDKWLLECHTLLNSSLDVSHFDGLELTRTMEQMENFITWEIVVRDLIHDADTYKSEDYLKHIQKCDTQEVNVVVDRETSEEKKKNVTTESPIADAEVEINDTINMNIEKPTQVSLMPGRVKAIADETVDNWDLFFVEKEKKEEKERQKIDKSFTKAEEHAEIQVEEQATEQVETQVDHEEEKMEEVNTENIDPKSNIMFTMNVDTQDINVVIDKSSKNIKKETEQKLEKPVEMELEQITSKPAVDSSEAGQEKEENVKAMEAKIKIITEPGTSSLDFRPTNVTDVLLDSTRKITECNALPFKAIDDTLPILRQIAPTCKVDDIIGYVGKLDTLSKFISSNIESIDKINEDTIRERTHKEIDDITDNLIGSSKLTLVLDREMVVYEEKIENIKREKARIRPEA
ncbi:uncharacterized protein LOC131859797 [Cryptomeria japonica]|uniref:uncharacterized protein LOC131859797 n=1 Tax=Cryptomeria japonica TaxID=3369 RepID=UPI0027DA1F35|nr:uncharacterized protein LOC131859797 [Cryptomeria japonica]